MSKFRAMIDSGDKHFPILFSVKLKHPTSTSTEDESTTQFTMFKKSFGGKRFLG